MFARFYTLFAVLAVASYASATFIPPFGGGGGRVQSSNDCNTGTLHCCSTDQNAAQTLGLTSMTGSLGGQLNGIDGVLGVQCNPITGFASGGSQSCSAQPACCKEKSSNGVATLDCFPVNVTV